MKSKPIPDGWFPVTGKLPHDNQRVLWLDASGKQYSGTYYQGKWYIDEAVESYRFVVAVCWKPQEPEAAEKHDG